MRHKGLEPSLLSKLDPKSSASTNSANAAEIGHKISKNITHTQILQQKKIILAIKQYLYDIFT